MKEIVLEGMVATYRGFSRQQVKIDSSSNVILEVGRHVISKRYHCFSDDIILFPGFVDLHVHARQDVSGKQNYKEDFKTASAAALNGGVIAFADMPNNPTPPLDEKSYHGKEQLTQDSSVFTVLYAGIGPNTSPFRRDVPYKVFMGPSVGELFFSDNSKLEQTLERYSGKSVSFHCEDPIILQAHRHASNHEDQRPPRAEIDAIAFALQLTEKYHLQTKICHVSTAEGLRLCQEAKAKGLNVTVEVTPHHLYFDRSILTDANRKLLQMNPPLRERSDREALMQGLKDGHIDYLASDHAPHTLAEKEKGASGVPHLDTYGLFVAWLLEQGIHPTTIARVCAYNPGKFVNRFLGTNLGEIKEGSYGQLTVIDTAASTTVTKEILQTKCGWSPFEGITFPGKVYMFPENSKSE